MRQGQRKHYEFYLEGIPCSFTHGSVLVLIEENCEVLEARGTVSWPFSYSEYRMYMPSTVKGGCSLHQLTSVAKLYLLESACKCLWLHNTNIHCRVVINTYLTNKSWLHLQVRKEQLLHYYVHTGKGWHRYCFSQILLMLSMISKILILCQQIHFSFTYLKEYFGILQLASLYTYRVLKHPPSHNIYINIL